MSETKIKIRDLHKAFGKKVVLDGVDLDIEKGESLVVIGGSGTGKSVLIKCIQGLLRPDSGSILIDEEEVVGIDEEQKEALHSKMGMLFQGGALFDSLSVWENVAFDMLENKKMDKRLAKNEAIRVLRSVGLAPDVADLSPSELSGGMRQRAALIRTLAMEPDLLLLDEPFSALDYQTRLNVCDDIGKIIKKEGKTAILVTHDISEAISMADRVIVLAARPAYVKKKIPIRFAMEERTPMKVRSAPEFKTYFNAIWKELNENA